MSDDTGSMYVHDAPGEGHDIMAVWVWVACGPNGERMVSGLLPGVGAAPLVTCRPATALKLESIAVAVGKASGRTVKRLRFDARVEIMVVDP